jgi:hypothetical protein
MRDDAKAPLGFWHSTPLARTEHKGKSAQAEKVPQKQAGNYSRWWFAGSHGSQSVKPHRFCLPIKLEFPVSGNQCPNRSLDSEVPSQADNAG